ncbi:antibiotic biosynthesis monooxygenase [Mucilaginibacter sabulilitoris]|uniref:Antibiotic biosynthesis monooxygenase n=1 Tax=Mucilaginibacter sabulilitoris TaxID=1173583 RepID=A0ABZ0TVT5_9SPHI|nr:antibiotic biosynthesis monooxygenase [Mucilaginibacter sabulilitoris]WPU95260.1 antibiotic biosynthesis monooxygenase [Mucilaginibacter sabulilitoris]
MKKINGIPNILKVVLIALLVMTLNNAIAQNKKRVVRIARIEIDTSQIDNYKAALKDIGEASLRTEPGVLMLYSVADKIKTNHITVMEIYADSTAYETHRQTAHFKKYKETIKNMVRSLELVDVDPIFTGIKPDILK